MANWFVKCRCGKAAVYEIWNLSMPARPVGGLCQECYDKKLSVRFKKWISKKWQELCQN